MYEFDSRVRYSETDAQGRMTWLALMDYFQDCSVFHSEAVNLGVEVWTDAQKAWILSSWQICLNRMPRLGEQITTQTWAYGMKGFYGYRNFSMNGRDGERMAYANSVWGLDGYKEGDSGQSDKRNLGCIRIGPTASHAVQRAENYAAGKI